MQATIQRDKLFFASCTSLLVTSLSFGIRAGLLTTWKEQFSLNQEQIGVITSTAFWGFPLAIVIGGLVVDIIGMKKLLVGAFLFHALGIVLTITAQGFWPLFISTLLIGMGNGLVEAACNPLVASLYTTNKTTKLNHFHLWFPGGIVIGTLIVSFFGQTAMGADGATKIITNWRFLVGLMLIPTVVYGYLFYKLAFPVTERVASGISSGDMYKALLKPLFLVMIVLMLGTAITELFTGQWIDVLLKNVTDNALLLLTIETGIMVIGRAFAGPIVHRLSAAGVLLTSAILASIGLYLLGHSTGNMLFVGAIFFGMGVCYFWPTMLGFVSENLPETGAVGLNFMGGAGMFAVSLYLIFMGGYYDRLQASKTPAEAGQAIINVTLMIPLVLTVAFAILFFYKRKKSVAPAV
ncbi:MAG: MFS transporter [Bacteroidota bacterium]|nr:MFS transporter [Bacteroidota bacterium]